MFLTHRVFSSVWAAITKLDSLGGLNNKCLFLTVLEAERSKIKKTADSVSDESLLSVSQMALFSLSSRGRERVREHSGVSFIRTLIPFMRVSPLQLIASQRTSLRTPSQWGLGIGIWILGRHNSQSTAESFSEFRNLADFKGEDASLSNLDWSFSLAKGQSVCLWDLWR